jgi:FkbM family methyltransferase
MIVNQYDFIHKDLDDQSQDGWVNMPLGYRWMIKCQSSNYSAATKELYKKIKDDGMIPGGEFQLSCLLSIIQNINKDKINVFELGAGWGRVCLNIAGAVDFDIIDCSPKSYNLLAVEAEPTHYKWLKEHFELQNINATTVFAAISNSIGNCQFDSSGSDPDAEYGQSISNLIKPNGVPSITEIFNYLFKKSSKVPMLTVDYLCEKYNFNHIDIVQMDVQGAEFKVLEGSKEAIKKGRIDYFLINIHKPEFKQSIPELLIDRYDLIVDLKQKEVNNYQDFPPIFCNDGIQLYARKDI